METVRDPFEQELPPEPKKAEVQTAAGTRLSVAANAIGYALNEDRADARGVVEISAAEAALHQRIAARVVSQLDEYDAMQADPADVYIMRPGDVLIIRFPASMAISAETADVMKQRVMRKLPGLKDVLIVAADQMEIYREIDNASAE